MSSQVAREWAVRCSLGLRLSTLVPLSLGSDVSSHAPSAPPCPPVVASSLVLLVTSLLKPYADPTSVMESHYRLSDVSTVPLQLFLCPELYSSSITFTVSLTRLVLDSYEPQWTGDWLSKNVTVKTYLDFLRLRHSYPPATASAFVPIASSLLSLLLIQILRSPTVSAGEEAVRSLVSAVYENGVAGCAGNAACLAMRKVTEHEDPNVNKRFGQALLLCRFHKLAPCVLAAGGGGTGGSALRDESAAEGWRTLLCVYAWLSSAAGGLGARAAKELGALLGPPSRNGDLNGYVDDVLVNYLFLGGPNSNVNRLASVLPLVTPLLVSLSRPTVDVEAMTRFLAVAGVSLKSDFVAADRVAGDDGRYLEYLVECTVEIEAMAEKEGGDGVLIDIDGGESGGKLRASQDLVLDATASLLVGAFRGGGSASTRALRVVVKGFKAGGGEGGEELTLRLVGMAMQRAARGEEVRGRLPCEGERSETSSE